MPNVYANPADDPALWGNNAPANGGPTAPVPRAPAPLPMVNRAQLDPRLDRNATRIEERIANPQASTGRAIDMAVGRLRDLGDGQKRSGVASFARRGMMGSGGQADYESGIDENVQQQGAGVAADITMKARQDDDRFLLDATNALAAPGNAGRADRSLADSQWEMENSARMRAFESENAIANQRQAAEFAQQQAILALLRGGEAPVNGGGPLPAPRPAPRSAFGGPRPAPRPSGGFGFG